MPKAKKKPGLNKNPYRTWPLRMVTHINGLEVYVAFQNAGMTWFSPTCDAADLLLFRGLVVFQVREDGSVKECYKRGRRSA